MLHLHLPPPRLSACPRGFLSRTRGRTYTTFSRAASLLLVVGALVLAVVARARRVPRTPRIPPRRSLEAGCRPALCWCLRLHRTADRLRGGGGREERGGESIARVSVEKRTLSLVEKRTFSLVEKRTFSLLLNPTPKEGTSVRIVPIYQHTRTPNSGSRHSASLLSRVFTKRESLERTTPIGGVRRGWMP